MTPDRIITVAGWLVLWIILMLVYAPVFLLVGAGRYWLEAEVRPMLDALGGR